MLQMENVRIQKQMRGEANRASNCDEHNTERMVTASQQQVDAIKLISIHRGLSSLPPALEQIARARLDHPDLSLSELGQMLEPPVGKSGVNHRMRRLQMIADEIMQKEPLSRSKEELL